MCIRDRVIAVTANSGYDANTGEELEDGADRELPGTVTLLVTPEPVSYTHLDVYKRQTMGSSGSRKS